MKIRITLILLLTATTFWSYGQNKFECQCKSYFQTVFNLTDKDNNKLLVCGDNIDTITTNSKEITSISVYDCSNKELVLTYDYDEIIPFTVTKYKDSIAFYNHHFVPIGDDWKMTSLPFTEWTIKFVEDTAEVTEGRVIFNYPDLSQIQIDSISDLCKVLNSYKDKEKTMYPLDYETIYVLFIGALKNIKDSRTIYENLKERFEFDGAAAETLGEIHYRTLIEN
ncbi:MAG: hypothetical protein HN704_09195 [Bacteroidetes bacterium]|jgi:hypothetical protein|nr:hypothetical protein [Bacteroidota bacterium]MBT6687623.1 hypothetical protein [Bacteroidota bacterium]MBT7144744.1 hypothetical protein [Bacteroidota bacterium]MBT7491768.1 hypothetical protein [Bacteroidota bacterium]